MIAQKDVQAILKKYNQKNIHIGVIGGHSALDVCRGAKDLGFNTVVVCEKGRERTYAQYFKTRGNKGIVDEIILVDKFKDITSKEVVEKLQAFNTIFIHSRYFWVYCDFDEFENNFLVPLVGNRGLLKAEERDQPNNQYDLLQKAGIRIPKQFSNPKDIDRLVIVKAAEKQRTYERAFFFADSQQSYKKNSEKLIKDGKITKEGLSKARIEEYIVGAQVNFNFFYSSLNDELELLGTDARRQTNIDGLIRLPANIQNEVSAFVSPTYIENGHIAVTVKESLLEKAFAAGEAFVKTVKKEYPPGIIGPFALQGAIIPGPPKEELIVFDVSLRIPGSPGTMFTPYSGYLYGENMSFGKRIAMEIKEAIKKNKLGEIIT
ncbi:MAG TPA: DUF1297 domain-containing protein [Candidatus Nanoarchaeia archaeon]|nr:DUF1297 domain-containing protein [Candidatus Nanoarchaeia archaeon]